MAFRRTHQSASPYIGRIKTTLTTDRGGSSSVSPDGAVAVLKGISVSKIGVPGGVLGLGFDAKIAPESDPRIVDTINGSLQVLANSTNIYQLTSYDFKKVYTVTAITGSVSISGENITYTAPSSASSEDGFVVNGVRFRVKVGTGYLVDPPTIVSPVNNAINVPDNFTIVSTALDGVGIVVGHLATEWQVSLAPDFGNLYWSFVDNTPYTTQVNYGSEKGLPPGTTCYLRVRYKDTASSWTLWSSVVKFTTSALTTMDTEIGQLGPYQAAPNKVYGVSVSCVQSSDGYTRVASSSIEDGYVDVWKIIDQVPVLEQRIAAPVGQEASQFGKSVKLSRNGLNLIVAAPFHRDPVTNGLGGLHVYTRTGSVWSYTLSGLGSSNPISSFLTGPSDNIAISNNGDMIIAGEHLYNSGVGCIHVLDKVTNPSNTAWSVIDAPVGYSGYASPQFGKDALALSPDGTTIAASMRVSATQFVVVLLKLTGGVWSVVKVIDDSYGCVDGEATLSSASFNSSGTVLVLGTTSVISGNNVRGGRASVWLYLPANGWNKYHELYETGMELVGVEQDGMGSHYGSSVAISEDGFLILVGAYSHSPYKDAVSKGCVFMYRLVNSIWTYAGFITPTASNASEYFGYDMSLSLGSGILAVGAPGFNIAQGRVVLFR